MRNHNLLKPFLLTTHNACEIDLFLSRIKQFLPNFATLISQRVMAKSKRHNLVFEQDFDFDMIGLCSHHNDYRLAWSINSELSLHLEASEEPYITEVKKNAVDLRLEFPMYEYHDKENHVDYFLIKNKVLGKFLISEKQNIDFFLFIAERGMIDLVEFVTKLRSVSSILAVFPFEAEEIDSAKKLVFY